MEYTYSESFFECEVDCYFVESVEFTAGEQVEVHWHGFDDWLGGKFIGMAECEKGESFEHIFVRMDHGIASTGIGFHPAHVKKAQKHLVARCGQVQ